MAAKIQERNFRKVVAYVDGFNLYYAIANLKQPWLKWIDLKRLVSTTLRQSEKLEAVHFFTAICTWDIGKLKRHENYIAALKCTGVRVHEGKFSRVYKECKNHDTPCKFKEEKFTDVAIAVKMLSDAFDNQFDRAILITADHDQIPSVEEISRRYPDKEITLAAPPGRRQQARELGETASNHMELERQRLASCLLPLDVYAPNGKVVATMPQEYAVYGCPSKLRKKAAAPAA